MAYIGAPPQNRVLSSDDIAQGAVTLNDINFTDQPTNMDITGTIDKHTMRLADGVTIIGDVTISDDLVLSKISDDGNAITMTNDGSSRTITGSGSIEASTLSQTPNQSLTGMTGTVGSAVTNNAGVASGVIGSGVTFPSGMPINIVSTTKSDIQQLGAAYTETEISGLTCTITPKYTTSKIYISGHVSVGHTVATAWNYINIFRGSTRIGQGPSDGTSIQGHSATDNRAYAMRSLPINYIDSPNTTSTITYSIKHGSGSANARINKDGESSGTNHVTGVSTLTVMEIAG